jgi:hypothetical protein
VTARSYARRVIPSGGPQHRIPKAKKAVGSGARVKLLPTHPALIDGHTIFPGSVVNAADAPRLLISGHNSRKIGKTFTRGAWRGMPIFTLTLEERATCPPSCEQWATCYGNNMHWSRRHRAGPELETILRGELDALNARHPGGFVVRLHILGDFYSAAYVDLWATALDELPALHIFGYTARDPESDIGLGVLSLSLDNPERCRIRFSGSDHEGFGSVVIDRIEDSEHVVCPAQTDKTDCCATCGLCPSMNRTVEFLRH